MYVIFKQGSIFLYRLPKICTVIEKHLNLLEALMPMTSLKTAGLVSNGVMKCCWKLPGVAITGPPWLVSG